MSDDSPDNAPVQAIYSARGLESLTIDYIYNFKNEQNTVTLKPFDEIASVVEEKYDNILNDVNYEVTRAKLYERVYTGEDQKYAEEPIWYFEVMENGSNKTVMLVNAETGKEINLHHKESWYGWFNNSLLCSGRKKKTEQVYRRSTE